MPRPSNTDARRRQIIDALAVVMAEHGYDGASTARIAEVAGLAPGLVHYHFATKEEILVALAGSLSEAIRARWDKRAARATTPQARLEAFLDAHLALGADARPALVRCWVVLGAEALRRPAVRTVYRAALGVQRDALRPLVREVLASQGRSTRAASAVTAALQSAILGAYQLAAAGAAPRGFAATAVRAMAEGLLAAQPLARQECSSAGPGRERAARGR